MESDKLYLQIESKIDSAISVRQLQGYLQNQVHRSTVKRSGTRMGGGRVRPWGVRSKA